MLELAAERDAAAAEADHLARQVQSQQSQLQSLQSQLSTQGESPASEERPDSPQDLATSTDPADLPSRCRPRRAVNTTTGLTCNLNAC